MGPPAPKAPSKTPAETVMAQYDDRYGPRRVVKPCTVDRKDDIVVCGNGAGTVSPYRLPMPDDRYEAGEAVRHPSEPASALAAYGARFGCHRPGCAEPSKFGETIGKIITFLKGEDPK